MKIGVIGASGFIGKAFCKQAQENGHEVIGYSRSQKGASDGIEWRVFDKSPNLDGLDAIVNYAGESVAQRWTEAKKVQFHKSRVGVTEIIVNQIKEMPADKRPKVLVNSSAVGYYGDCADTKLDEGSPLGPGYLAELCQKWEQAAYEAEALGVRVVIGRIGIVIGEGGAAWEQMKTAFKLGAGGNLSTGKQWMPWVHVDDVAGASLYACETESIKGAVNFVSPEPCRNSEFTQVLAKSLNRPAFIPAPKFALKLLFGEFGTHLLDSYRVYPAVLEREGYNFQHPKLKESLAKMA